MSHAFMHIYNSITIFCNRTITRVPGRREASVHSRIPQLEGGPVEMHAPADGPLV